MKTLLTTLFIQFFSIVILAQSTDDIKEHINKLEKKVDSVEYLISKQDLVRDSLNKEMELLKSRLKRIESENFEQNGIQTVVNFIGGTLEATPYGEDLMELSEGDTIYVIGIEGNHYEVRHEDLVGYIGKAFVEKNNRLEEYLNEVKPKLRELINRYGEAEGRKIYRGQIWLGMTANQARMAIGRPDDINRSVGSYGTHEQWVYQDKYLYFENGKLTSWQN